MNPNRALVERCMEAFNRHDATMLAELVTEDFINHAAIPEAQGRSGLISIWEKLWTAFPDLTHTCEDIIVDGDRVACRIRVRGTNSGPLRFSRMPLPATGKAMDTEAIHIFRVVDGRLAETWSQRDEVGMLRQLGQLAMQQRPAA
jgi:steroid delta-isomerase-like uncharacterized protein